MMVEASWGKDIFPLVWRRSQACSCVSISHLYNHEITNLFCIHLSSTQLVTSAAGIGHNGVSKTKHTTSTSWELSEMFVTLLSLPLLKKDQSLREQLHPGPFHVSYRAFLVSVVLSVYRRFTCVCQSGSHRCCALIPLSFARRKASLNKTVEKNPILLLSRQSSESRCLGLTWPVSPTECVYCLWNPHQNKSHKKEKKNHF